ncbi:MAG: shikimate dehydrogenase [Clostridia bacterium]|nr:shikimate dehydrogenase [Clostridia bacterium]
MKYGVIGEHLKHSFSKEIHEKIANYKYDICEVEPNKLGELLTKAEFNGINVTIPYKEKVIPYLCSISDKAKRIGAVNTVVNKDGMLYGYNTDYMGMKALILRNGIDLSGKKALIMGNGGTAKTGHCVLADLGAKEIIHVGREFENPDVLYGDVVKLHSDADFILNTTPVGMFPKNEGKIIDIADFPKLMGLIDVVYNPLRTNIVLDAKEKGIPAESGLYMLVSQAVYASEFFTGEKYAPEIQDSVFKDILKQKENIALIGMPSSGKTTVGKYLAKLTGKEFIDTDDEIIKIIGTDIPTYFREHGEGAFRDVEAQVIEEVSKKNGLVISTGGGAILRPENVRCLKQNSRVYFLNRSLDLLMPTASRPLSSDISALKKRFEERYDKYISSADVEIMADGTVEEVGNMIKEEFYK